MAFDPARFLALEQAVSAARQARAAAPAAQIPAAQAALDGALGCAI